MAHVRNGPIRILHVVGGMNRGGVETWLMHVLRHVDRDRFQMDFLVHSLEPGVYDDEIRFLGGGVIPCLRPGRPWKYARNFKRVLETGAYDIVHSHVHHFSGFVLRLARQAGVPIRIAHSHTDTSSEPASFNLLRRAYLDLSSRWIRRHATAGLAGSQKSADSLFGPQWARDGRWKILYCSIDLAPFADRISRTRIRGELGIPADAVVIGHAGRFVSVKNHSFIVDIASEVLMRDPRAYFLLVGDGPLRTTVEEKVAAAGLSERFIITGLRSDLPHLMRGGMDMFLLPSLYEGVPLVLMEAQAAGLPCVFSDVISSEADIVQPLVHRLDVTESATTWASTVLAAREKRLAGTQAFETVKQSPFNIEVGVKELTDFYMALSAKVK